MEILKFDTEKRLGAFKYLNAVNNGPIHKRHTNDQLWDNFEAYKKARIPYARNHDASFESKYGGQFSVDISAVFPNFDADVNDPNSYDFACTDENIAVTSEAGTETFYRLGQRIEHEVRKHNIFPPKDFKKWALICEHIIRHYNEKWADGFEYNLEYWEIWNEPDLDCTNPEKARTWAGTEQQFYDLYEITAKHLKSCFPNLKIGGPALACRFDWADRFLSEMSKRDVPIDFFSWHCYTTNPDKITLLSSKVREMLDKYGYLNTQSILNEWNYIKGWTDKFIYTIKSITGLKGASFALACMCLAQASTIDMLMYYDARPSVFNGLFDFYSLEPLKGYYPFYWYGKFYDLQSEIRAQNKIDNIYSLCGCSEDGKILCALTYYSDDDNAQNKSISLDFKKKGNYNVYLLDEKHDSELVDTTSSLSFELKVHQCLLIEEI